MADLRETLLTVLPEERKARPKDLETSPWQFVLVDSPDEAVAWQALFADDSAGVFVFRTQLSFDDWIADHDVGTDWRGESSVVPVTSSGREGLTTRSVEERLDAIERRLAYLEEPVMETLNHHAQLRRAYHDRAIEKGWKDHGRDDNESRALWDSATGRGDGDEPLLNSLVLYSEPLFKGVSQPIYEYVSNLAYVPIVARSCRSRGKNILYNLPYVRSANRDAENLLTFAMSGDWEVERLPFTPASVETVS